MTFIITPAYDGRCVRDYMRGELQLSHSLLIKLKAHPAGIMLNGERVTVRRALQCGDVLELAIGDGESSGNVAPSAAGLAGLVDVLYEDEYILAVNKPHGMPVHPSHGHYGDTLANAVAGYYQSKCEQRIFRAANRLDRDTTGVVIIAKDALTAQRLGDRIAGRKVEKVYLAKVRGDILAFLPDEVNRRIGALGGSCVSSPDGGYIIDAPIRRAQESIITRMIAPDGAAAVTRFEVLRNGMDSLLRIYPVTGRTHQIRVHFAGAGFPIAGDTLYGDADDPEALCLHCESMGFEHPHTGEYMLIKAQSPL